MSSDNILGAEQGSFLKPKRHSTEEIKEIKAVKKSKKLNFLLSYMQDERDFFVTLFLVNESLTNVNSDITIILSQQISHLDVVEEEPVEEGDLTPPAARRGTKTPNFASPLADT